MNTELTMIEAARNAIVRAARRESNGGGPAIPPESVAEWLDYQPEVSSSHFVLPHQCDDEKTVKLWPGEGDLIGRPARQVRLDRQVFTFDGNPDTAVGIWVGHCPRCKRAYVAEAAP